MARPTDFLTSHQLGLHGLLQPAHQAGKAFSPLLPLAPWVLPIIVVGLVVLGSSAGVTQPYAAAYPVDPRIGLLFAPALGISLSVYLLALPLVRRGTVVALLITTGVLAATSGAWACGELIGHRASGATGSDPYAYAQMAVDLVRTGTVLHRFDVLSLVLHPSLNLTWDPLVHIGYHLPVNEPGDAPTVWPMGAAILLALGYLVGGEAGLYWVNPLATFGAAAATGWLAWMLFGTRPRPLRLAVAGLAGAIILTSNEQVLWARVPMADAQAELFTTLAFVGALWVSCPTSILRNRPRATAAVLLLSGAMLGAAYLTRHTQVLVVPALAILVLGSDLRESARRAGLIMLGALLLALPDFWYRQQSLGGWLRPESEEWRLFSSAALFITPDRLWSALIRGDEFGWLLPLIAAGGWRLARDDRRALLALLAWLMVLVGFHLPYPALRLRDLIPEFPVVAALAAIGAAWVVEAVRHTGRRPMGQEPTLSPSKGRVRAALSFTVMAMCLFLTIHAFVLRFWSEAYRPFDPPEHVFGYLTPQHRAAFGAISRLVPANAIIAADFNDGALDLMSDRDTVRAGLWSPWEQHLFFCRAQSRGRSLYVLDDSQAIESMLRGLRAQEQTLVSLARFELPLFPGEPRLEDSGRLWRVDSPCGA